MLLQQRSLKICSWLPLWPHFLPLIKMLYTCLPYGTAHHSLNLPVSLNSAHGTEYSSISDLPEALVPAHTLGSISFAFSRQSYLNATIFLTPNPDQKAHAYACAWAHMHPYPPTHTFSLSLCP